MLSAREMYAIKSLRDSLVKIGDQYQAGCVWAPGKGRPPPNRKQAENRLISLERSKYFKKQDVRRHYGSVIQDWARQAFVRKVPEGVAKHFLPHFPIIKESSSTPVRPVMDCATGLNSYILSGPNLLNEVTAVLLRYRSGLFSFSGDVKQMFLRIWMAPEDRPYHCFLWRDTPTQPMEVYQFQVHVFGNAGSPFVAVYTVKNHAQMYKESMPRAVAALQHSTLIDDVLDSADTLEEATADLQDVASILASANMTISKLHASHPDILSSFPEDQVARGVIDMSRICQKEAELVNLKTLGIRYQAGEDRFGFEMAVEVPAAWTRREVLKIFPRLYDPLGLVLPFTMVARIYFSKINKLTDTWDERFEPHQEWITWLEELADLQTLFFPRCVKQELALDAQLHIFADASAEAYAAAAYLRSVDSKGAVSVRLVMAGGHVAPSKTQTIPRLELLAAVLSVKIRKYVVQHLKIVISRVYHWTDSLTVLYWINNDSTRFQAFVANNLNKIRRATDIEEWKWVPTDLNPADLPSRGVGLRRLLEDNL